MVLVVLIFYGVREVHYLSCWWCLLIAGFVVLVTFITQRFHGITGVHVGVVFFKKSHS